MDKIKIAIVEDEMIIAETLQDILEEFGYEVTGLYMRAKAALKAFEVDTPDFALLDINLKGEETGIWLGSQIKKNFEFPFIYLTSFGDKKTIADAKETNPYGFLMKPIDKQNVFASIEIALKNYSERTKFQEKVEIDNYIMKDCLFVKDEYYFTKINFDDILFVKSNGNYLEINTIIKMIMIRGSLISLLDTLPKNKFVQTHRSYLINLSRMEGFGTSTVRVVSHEIPLSKTLRDHFLSKLRFYQASGDSDGLRI